MAEADAAPAQISTDRVEQRGRPPVSPLIVPLIVALAFVLEQIDSNIVTIAIPQIARGLGAAPLKLDVLVTCYIISVAIFLPISGWAADRFGSRRVFCCAIAVFTLSSAACGFADSVGMLVVGRVIQGMGGAMMTPVGRLIMLRSFAKRDRITAMNYMMISVIVGPALGPLTGGFIVAHASWRWIFFINIPIGVLGIASALRFFAPMAGVDRRAFDFPGFALAAFASASFMFGAEAIAHRSGAMWVGVAGLLAGAGVAGLYAVHARRTAHPVLDLSLFRLRTVGVGVISGGLCRLGMNAPNFLLPFLLQIVFGLRPMQAGTLMFSSFVGAFSSRLITRRLLARLGFGLTLTVNAVVAALWIAGFALLAIKTPVWVIAIYLFGYGVLRTIQYNSINSLIYSELEEAALSGGTSVAGVAQQLATAIGVTICAALLSTIAGPSRPPDVGDFRMVMLIVAMFPLISMVGFLRLKPSDGAEVSGYGVR